MNSLGILFFKSSKLARVVQNFATFLSTNFMNFWTLKFSTLLPKESGFFQTVACQTSSVFQRLNVVVVVVVGIIIIVPTFLLFASQNSCHIYIYIFITFSLLFLLLLLGCRAIMESTFYHTTRELWQCTPKTSKFSLFARSTRDCSCAPIKSFGCICIWESCTEWAWLLL
jgi:hypothetical protein